MIFQLSTAGSTPIHEKNYHYPGALKSNNFFWKITFFSLPLQLYIRYREFHVLS